MLSCKKNTPVLTDIVSPFCLQPVSPVKDELDALSRFEIGRIDVAGMLNHDSSLEVKVKLQSISLDDIREHSNLAVKRY